MRSSYYLFSAVGGEVEVPGSVDQVSVASVLDEAEQEDDEEADEDQDGQDHVGPQQTGLAFSRKEEKNQLNVIFTCSSLI